MRTYDSYLTDLEHLSTNESEYQRCPYCGERHEEMGEYRGESMCLDCVEIERTSDTEKALAPSYAELFRTA